MEGKDSFYCSFDSFVAVDYIICECGDTFPSEDDLKEHLDKFHNNKNETKPTRQEQGSPPVKNVAAKPATVVVKIAGKPPQGKNILARKLPPGVNLSQVVKIAAKSLQGVNIAAKRPLGVNIAEPELGVNIAAKRQQAVNIAAKPPPGMNKIAKPAQKVNIAAKPPPGVNITAKPQPGVNVAAKPQLGVNVAAKSPPGVNIAAKLPPGMNITAKPLPGLKIGAKPPQVVNIAPKPLPELKIATKPPPGVNVAPKPLVLNIAAKPTPGVNITAKRPVVLNVAPKPPPGVNITAKKPVPLNITAKSPPLLKNISSVPPDNVISNVIVYNDDRKCYVIRRHIKKDNNQDKLPAKEETKCEETSENDEIEEEYQQIDYQVPVEVKDEPANDIELEQYRQEDHENEMIEIEIENEQQMFLPASPGHVEEVSVEDILQCQMQIEHNYEKPVNLQEFYFCEVCGKSFTTEKSVTRHLFRVHEMGVMLHTRKAAEAGGTPRKNVKNKVCELCGKKYASHAALRYHQRVHTGEKPYKCTVCEKRFTMPLFLQVHTRIHTGERPYPCNVCPKAFSNKAALLRHDRVHTGVRPYVCPYCCKAFTQSNSMKLHVKTVHFKMPAPYKSKARKLKEMMRQARLQEDGVIIKTKTKTVKPDVAIKVVPAKRVKYEVEESQDLEGELVYQEDGDQVIYEDVIEEDNKEFLI